ncbi:unnamed protein product [Caenorhabditis sp. 36 PRJEB53466]|nr:unnamed protein product [Caenorhabditis sp. 36 PRJEB53466]
MLVNLLLLLLLSIFSATGAHKLPEPTEPPSSRAPLVDLFTSFPKCMSTAWRDTYNQATFVAVVDAISTALQNDGSFIVSYNEFHRFKGVNAPQLRTAKDPIVPGNRYLVATLDDGRLYYCKSFSSVDGGVPSGAPRYMNVPMALILKINDWSNEGNSRLTQAVPKKKLSDNVFSDF